MWIFTFCTSIYDKKNVKNIGKSSNYPGLKYSEALTYSVFVIPVKFVFKCVWFTFVCTLHDLWQALECRYQI